MSIARRIFFVAKMAVVIIFVSASVGAAIFFYYAFAPPDPSQIRHEMESAGLWPIMIELADRALAGKIKPEGVDSDWHRLMGGGPVHVVEPFMEGKVVVTVGFEFGGADNHHGVLISRTGAASPLPNGYWRTYYVQRWGDGIWYYSEITPRKRRTLPDLPR